MKRPVLVLIVMTAVLMSSCADAGSGSETDTVKETTAVTTTTAAVQSKKPVDNDLRITAEVTGYKDCMLSFVYEGEEYTLFYDLTDRSSGEPNLQAKIINNRFGEKVTARLTLNSDKSRILALDAETPNGASPPYVKTSEGAEKYFTFKRRGGSLCEFTNGVDSFELDLNDLDTWWKLDYPETIYPAAFQYYEFKSGSRILRSFSFNNTICDDGTLSGYSDGPWIEEHYGIRNAFFGVVQSAADGKATVLLNDKKTLVTVPAYYNDGEITEGQEAAVIIHAETSLFGSGGTHEYDYAVIVTNKALFPAEGLAFGEYAYTEYGRTGKIFNKPVTVSRASAQ